MNGNGVMIYRFTTIHDTGVRQHEVRQAWRAWCLSQHERSARRDRNLDCFDNGDFLRIDWSALRRFAVSGPEARALVTGSVLSPAAFAKSCDVELADSCLWPDCSEIGTFEHVCWTCPRRPVDFDIPPRPGEFVTARFGWPLYAQDDVARVQLWLTHVVRFIWDQRHTL